MKTGEIIFAVMVAIHGLLFLIGLGYLIAFIKSSKTESYKLYYTSAILWGIAPVFSIVGVFFGFLL